jgi:hypothetical protein
MRLLISILILGGAVSAGAAEGTPPARPILPRDTGIAPPTRVPNADLVSTVPAGTPVATAAIPRALRRTVAADAAKRFGVTESDVVLVRAEQVTWSDGSLGCAEPGGIYTQALVPGYLIVAKTTQGELSYHTDSRSFARSCDAARKGGNKLSDRLPVNGSQPITGPPTPDR